MRGDRPPFRHNRRTGDSPINKANIQSSTFTFPGHTEYLEASLGEGTDKALMILYNDVVKVALVTTHLPLARIPQAITKDAIIEKLKIFDTSLRRDFGIVHPRIAVLSLNPHAGDGGLLGTEERDVIIPAIEDARKERIECFGPYAADGFSATACSNTLTEYSPCTTTRGLPRSRP